MDGQRREIFKRSAKMTRTPPQVANTTNNIRCGLCKKGPKHGNIVQCDKCNVWYHYNCVGVDDSVMERDWYCPKCETIDPRTIEENLREDSGERQENQFRNLSSPRQDNEFTNPLLSRQEIQFMDPSPSIQEQTMDVASNIVHPVIVGNQQLLYPNLTNTIPPFTVSGEVLLSSALSQRKMQVDSNSTSQNEEENSSTISQTTIRPSQRMSRGKSSSKSRSVSSKASSVIDLTLQRLEEERELKEKRDKEYLDKKYSFLQDELVETDDENIYRSDLVNDWVMDQDQYNQAPIYDRNYELQRPSQLSSTTNPERGGVRKKIYPIQSTTRKSNSTTIPENITQINGGYGSASNDPGISAIYSVQNYTDPTTNQQTFNNFSRTQIHVPSSNHLINMASSSSNIQNFRSEANFPLGNTAPIMSSFVSGTDWNFKSNSNPISMPYMSATNQHQINSSSGIINSTSQSHVDQVIISGGSSVPIIRSRTNNARLNHATVTSGVYSSISLPQGNNISSGGGLSTVQSQINTATSFGGIFNHMSQVNTSSMPNYGGNHYSTAPIMNQNVPIINTSGFSRNIPIVNPNSFNGTIPTINTSGFNGNVPFVNPNGANSSVPIFNSNGLNFNGNVPFTNANNSGFSNTTFQPQMSFVPPTYRANNSFNQMIPVAQFGNNFGIPGGLDYQNIATRLAFKDKNLKFSGKPEDWPLFESEFLESSRMCGYSDGENLSRLRKMLTEDALNAVKFMLQGSMNLPMVLSTLRMLYGKPEAVINALYQRALETDQIRPGKLDLLIKFSLTVLNLCGTMVSSGLTNHLNNPTLLTELVSKLPDNLKLEWGAIKRYNPHVNLSDLGSWLYDKAQDASEVTVILPKLKTGSDKKEHSKSKPKSENQPSFLNSHVTTDSTSNGKKIQNSDKKFDKSTSSTSGSCPICQKTQCKVVENCPKFKSLSQKERWDKVVANKLCRRCFGQHHHFRCKIQKKCEINGCERLHHKLLHKDNVEDNPEMKNENSSIAQQSRLNTHQISGENTFLPIVPVNLTHHGRTVRTFAFFDEGSTITLVETRHSRELELSGIKKNLCLRWTNGIVHSEKESTMVSLNISGIRSEHSSYHLPVVRTVENLGLPEQSINMKELTTRYPYLKDISVDEFNRVKIGILIGGNYAKLALPTDIREGDWGEPVARKTRLGWVISGPHDGESGQRSFVNHHVHECPCQGEHDRNLEKMVTDFFSLENFGVQTSSTKIESKEEQRARKILEKTTKFLGDRYETGLIWRHDEINLPNNFDMALKRLECVERKMASNPKLFENFNKQIQEFLVKGYARKLKRSELPLPKGRTWYLPLFPHVHPKKPEKIRPVWDAAAKYKGVSLNSSLLTGPDLYVPLPDVLLRFRERKIPVCGDIREMYHQVRIKKEDQYAQLFLWRNGISSNPPETYVMEVMTFGSTCSPSCAQYIKNLNANKFLDKYPRAVDAIINNHYVDDLMDSVHTENEAIKLLTEVKHIHKQGGFEIRGILSTSRKVLDAFGEDCKTSAKILDIESSTVTERVLGMFWDVKSDCFTYLLKYTKIAEDVLSGKRRPTKRELLKTLMSIFDPLGLLAFFLVYLKIVMQETWINNIQWDEPLSDELYEKWNHWLKYLPQVENIKIPRLYSRLLSPKEPEIVEIHTFVDAGENAYSAVSYLRIISEDQIEVTLVGAKSKVAPKQKLSIPKLELLSAVLGSRLAQSLTKGLSINIGKRYFHSDSQTVLGWIKCNHRKLRQFVAFRVGEIIDLSKEYEWRYVPGKENVADDATKWIKEPNFNQECRWFQGPAFLKQNESYWPEQILNDETEEMREEFKLHLVHMPIDPPTSIDPRRFSKWERMVRAQAYVDKCAKIWMSKVRKEPLPNELLTHEELVHAEKTLYSLAQFDYFAEEIAILKCGDKSKAKIDASSPLYECSPYLDEFGLLRMRGRIDAVDGVEFDTKRPIIMPTKHYITRLIADSYHRRLFHCHHEIIVNEMLQRFHVPGVKSLVRKVVKDCQKCRNIRAKPIPPEMADLPLARLSHHQLSFSFVGIDYFGPMYITHRRKQEKRWGVIFTCLTMRAIHIEVAETLDTQSCIWCIRNFMAIRGTPLEFFSDNGTNLKSADKELKEELKKVDQTELHRRFSIHSKWNFNPPSSPHMAGTWERMIRSVKKCLKLAIPERAPPYEMLRSLLMEVLNIVNSRPLTFVSIDSAEQEAITPNHLLVGSSSGSKKNDNWDASSSVLYPSGDFKEDAKIIGRNWRISQQRANYFWKRWVKSYLPTLTKRTKWFEKAKPIKIGDVVVIVDEKNHRNTWPKGVVIDTPKIDKNGQVRSATVKVVTAVGPIKTSKEGKIDVKTVESVYVRPVHKLAILDIKKKEEVEVKEI